MFIQSSGLNICDFKAASFKGSTPVIHPKNNETILVSITGKFCKREEGNEFEPYYDGSYWFKATIINNKLEVEKIGDLVLQHFQIKNGKYWSEDKGFNCVQINYYNNEVKQSYLDITWIISNHHCDIKGLGMAWIQLAVEVSMRLGCEGRLVISEAAYSALEFYYKRGFRALDEKINKYIEDEIQETHPVIPSEMRIIKMFLPENAIKNIMLKQSILE